MSSRVFFFVYSLRTSGVQAWAVAVVVVVVVVAHCQSDCKSVGHLLICLHNPNDRQPIICARKFCSQLRISLPFTRAPTNVGDACLSPFHKYFAILLREKPSASARDTRSSECDYKL